MKTLFLFLICIPAITIANSERKIESSIKEVTVYMSGASIKRTAITDLIPGVNELVFYNLSNKIDENSIQVSGLKNASVLSINYGINYLEKKKNSVEIQSLENQLDELLLQKNNFENLLSGLLEEKKVLDHNKKIGSNQTELSLEKVKEISTYYRERLVAINNEIYSINQKTHLLDDQISSITNQIDELNDHTKEERGEITLKLDASSSANLALTIRYTVRDAGWFPLYDIKSQNSKMPLNIIYKANVYQKTGSDWNNTNIILSTGDPSTNNVKPNLSTKYLNFHNGAVRKNKAINRYSLSYNPNIKTISGIVTDENGQPLPGVNIIEKGTNNGAVTDFDGAYNINISKGKKLTYSYLGYTNEERVIGSSIMNVELGSEDGSLEEVLVVGYGTSKGYNRKQTRKKEKKESYNSVVKTKEKGITNTRFMIKKKYSIKSNTDITTIEIDKFNMNATYSYYAAPELNENVFLTAKLGNWEEFDLLAGEANIYYEGSYAGKTNIDPQAITDSLTISLGTDPNIIIKREAIKNFKRKSFYGNNRIVDLGYNIKIKNNKQNNIQLTLEDRIPVSQNKEIKIEEIETGSSDFDDKTGIIRWKINLNPKEIEEKQFSYQLKYPKHRRVNM